MDDFLNYETYLLISSKKFIISVNTDFKKKVYYQEVQVDNYFKSKDLEKLDFFLNQNIFKIEKKFQSFVEKIIIVLDFDVFFPVEISIKKDNYNNYLNLSNLKHLLHEAKQCCKKTLDKKRVIHMLIKNYKVDGKNYVYFPDNIKCHDSNIWYDDDFQYKLIESRKSNRELLEKIYDSMDIQS